MLRVEGAHHSLADLAGCLLHLGHYSGRLFEDGMLYYVAKDGTEGYVGNCRHPWGPAHKNELISMSK